MKRELTLSFCLGGLLLAGLLPAQTNTNSETRELLGWATNGPAVLQQFRVITPITNRFPPHIATNRAALQVFPSLYTRTNPVFHSFLPESLHHTVWTNFLTLTNGRDLRIWSQRAHPEGWPTNRPMASWNTNSVIWPMRGLTALSPCWEAERNPGQVPFTALTRRHAYTRGHGMGPESFNTGLAGLKVWFLTRSHSLVEVVIKRNVVRVGMGTNGVYRDYTIAIFDRDLPDSIEPVCVATSEEVLRRYPLGHAANWPKPVFQTEQSGYVNTGVAPLVVNAWKGGDSGSPNLLPLPGELVFFSGRSTSGPTPEMQADMDELCRLEKLDPRKYQMQWVDLSNYPAY